MGHREGKGKGNLRMEGEAGYIPTVIRDPSLGTRKTAMHNTSARQIYAFNDRAAMSPAQQTCIPVVGTELLSIMVIVP